jgi:hypothetical protein
MKSTAYARRRIKLRFLVLCLVIELLAVIDFVLFESVASRIGQSTATVEVPQAPAITMSDLMAAGR